MPRRNETNKPPKKINKITAVTRALSDMAHELGPGAKMPTVAELCTRVGASVVTLNEALSQAEALHLIDRKHGVGLYVSPTLRKGVALVCAPRFYRHSTSSPFWELLVEHSEKRAALKNENFFFYFDPSLGADGPQDEVEESSLGHAVASRQVQGVIAIGARESLLDWLEEKQVPVVAYATLGRRTVSFNGAGGVQSATEVLLGRGCRNLELWLPAREEHVSLTASDDEHVTAFRRALQQVEGAQGQVREAELKGNQTGQEQGFTLAQHVFGVKADGSPTQTRPDGVVLTNDLVAHGALIALQKLDVKIGFDVQIATHANAGSPVLLGHDNLLLIENDPAELVATMFNLLESLMSGASSQSQSVHVSLAPHLRWVGDASPKLPT